MAAGPRHAAATSLEDERFEMLVDGVKDYLILMLDPQGIVSTWNSGAERATGYTAREIIGRHVSVLFPPESEVGVSWEDELAEALRTGRSENQGWRLRKDGSRFWVNAVVTVLRAPDGSLRGFAKITRDLTERRAAELKLRESEQRLHLLIGSIQDYAIFMLDASGHIMTWNPGAERIKGYTATEIIGEHFSRFYPENDVRAGKCESELIVAASAGRFEEEGWRIRKDGSRFWASVVITAVRDERGELVGFGKVTRDLTARRQAEEQLRQSELRLRQLIDSIRDHAVIMLDPSGHIATWNPGAERIHGYTAGEIVGQHFSRFYVPEDVAAGKCEHELVVAAEVGRFEDEGWRVRKDGGRFWASVVLNAVRNDGGELVGFSKVTRDLTEHRRMEEEREARRAAEASSRAKDEFLAMLGHELRNPLAPMVTAMQLLGDRCGEHSPRELQVMQRQVQHMVRLVDDLLDVSRLAGGRTTLEKVFVNLTELLESAIETASPLLEQRRHVLGLDAPRNGLVVLGDPHRLIQVFANLLTNAAKYTDVGGRITVRGRVVGDEAVVSVEDNGRGIVAELLPRLFDLFVQGNQSAERSAGGLGLGLAIVKSLVELHGGTVVAASPGEGRGSTFVVRLPLARGGEAVAAAPAGHVPLPDTSAQVRILLVDDNEDARELTAMLLVRVGHHVVTAPDGPTALALAARERFDVAILDIGLPVMDGFELAGRLRDIEGGQELRIIALTGYGQLSDRERSRSAGFQRHLTKPVDPAYLLATILELCPPAPRRE